MKFLKTAFAIAILSVAGVAQADSGWRYSGMAATDGSVGQTMAMGKQPDSTMPATGTGSLLSYPANNMSMTAVRNEFGHPGSELPGVGMPSIVRWQYPEYTVYFEINKVLTTVVN